MVYLKCKICDGDALSQILGFIECLHFKERIHRILAADGSKGRKL